MFLFSLLFYDLLHPLTGLTLVFSVIGHLRSFILAGDLSQAIFSFCRMSFYQLCLFTFLRSGCSPCTLVCDMTTGCFSITCETWCDLQSEPIFLFDIGGSVRCRENVQWDRMWQEENFSSIFAKVFGWYVHTTCTWSRKMPFHSMLGFEFRLSQSLIFADAFVSYSLLVIVGLRLSPLASWSLLFCIFSSVRPPTRVIGLLLLRCGYFSWDVASGFHRWLYSLTWYIDGPSLSIPGCHDDWINFP